MPPPAPVPPNLVGRPIAEQAVISAQQAIACQHVLYRLHEVYGAVLARVTSDRPAHSDYPK